MVQTATSKTAAGANSQYNSAAGESSHMNSDGDIVPDSAATGNPTETEVPTIALPAAAPESLEDLDAPDGFVRVVGDAASMLLVLPDWFPAMVICAAKEHNRFAINSVHLKVAKGGKFQAVATDGHRLAVVSGKLETAAVGEWLVPVAVLESVKRLVSGSLALELNPAGQAVALCWTVQGRRKADPAMPQRVALVDDGAKYPQWEAVMPKRTDWAPLPLGAGFNAEYLADFGKLFEALGAVGKYGYGLTGLFGCENPMKPLTVLPVCNGTGLEIVGMVMPCKTDWPKPIQRDIDAAWAARQAQER